MGSEACRLAGDELCDLSWIFLQVSTCLVRSSDITFMLEFETDGMKVGKSEGERGSQEPGPQPGKTEGKMLIVYHLGET